MKYQHATSLAGSLGLTPERVRQLNAAFSVVCESLPDDARRTELHERLAVFINTPEEAYFMGNMAREFINNLDAMAQRPITMSAN